MEAAKPIISISTPIDTEEKMIDIKSSNIEVNNQKYILEFAKSENNKKIIFKITKNSNVINNQFLLILDEEEFQNLNPIFKIYQNINDIYTLLIDILNDKKYNLIEKEKEIILIMKFNIYKGKEIDIEFNLKEKMIKKEDMINKLYLLVNNLIEENKLLKDEFTKKNNELNNEIIYLKEELKNKDKEIINIKTELGVIKKEILKEKGINKNFLNESAIIKKNEEKSNLISWISEKGKIKNINLLYRATRDGDNHKSFYDKCSNKGPTLSLIKTKSGRRFGGFSFVEWSDKIGMKRLKDINAFLYSLDNMEKYNILKPELAVCCYSNHSSFLTYGNNADSCGIFLYDNFLQKKNGNENHKSRVYNVTSDYCLSGENCFNVEEVEVFNVTFESLS